MDQNPENHFAILKAFLENQPASQKAVRCLKDSVEIQIIIEPDTVCSFFQKDNAPQLENRLANNPDVEFRITPKAIDILVEHPADDMGEFGIAVVKQYMKGEVKIRVLGGAMSMLKNGYIRIIKEAGPGFFKFLTENGLSSLGRLPEIFKSLRR